jgi:transcription-repair coupling factor (superfamily II helicase)
MRLTIHAESEVFGRERVRIERVSAHKTFASDFRDLKVGDLIVHYDHGIGRYAGLIKPSGMAGERDFMLILYAGGDKLYLPVDRLDLVQRYSGAEGKKGTLGKGAAPALRRTEDHQGTSILARYGVAGRVRKVVPV